MDKRAVRVTFEFSDGTLMETQGAKVQEWVNFVNLAMALYAKYEGIDDVNKDIGIKWKILNPRT